MSSLRDNLERLAKLRRSRNNLDEIREQLDELTGFADDAEQVTSAMQEAREAVEELQSAGDEGNPLTSWLTGVHEACDVFMNSPVGEERDDISGVISEAVDLADEYEQSLDDRDIPADDRQEIWDNLCDALTNIAQSME